MSILVVGSVFFDSIETPHGKVDHALGGAATYFSVAASFFAPVKMVATVGEDFPRAEIDFLSKRGIDVTSGEWVTVTTAQCVPDDSWVASLLESLEEGVIANRVSKRRFGPSRWVLPSR